MSVDILLASLSEFWQAKTDHVNGQETVESVVEARRRVAEALNNYIDFRVNAILDDRRRTVSHDRINIAESINSAMKSTASSVRSMAALNAAPIPPENPNDAAAMKKWADAYKEWYSTQRKRGISVE